MLMRGIPQFKGLGRQETVEGIAMVKREQPGANGVEGVNLEESEFLFAENLEKVGDQHVRRHLPGIDLDGDFPGNDGGDENFVGRVSDKLASAPAESLWAIERPNGRMGVEQELHAAGSSSTFASTRMSKPYSRNSSSVSSGLKMSSEY